MIIPCLKTLKLHSLFLKKVSLLNSLLIGGLIIITLRTDRKKICLYHLQRPSIVQVNFSLPIYHASVHASVQSLLLAGHFVYNKYQPSASGGKL